MFSITENRKEKALVRQLGGDFKYGNTSFALCSSSIQLQVPKYGTRTFLRSSWG